MKNARLLGLATGLCLGLAACGSNTDDTLDATVSNHNDAAVKEDLAIDTTPMPVAYYQVAIYDKEEGAAACTTTGPGADIDAVALLRAGTVAGYGLINSAVYTPAVAPTCTGCGSSGKGDCTHADPTLVTTTEGPDDAEVYQTETDTGYLSLNGGSLGILIGNTLGSGTSQPFYSGDAIQVYEIDKNYNDNYAACTCTPERYEVWAAPTPGSATGMVQLMPSAYDAANIATCGGTAPMTGDTTGCGTTVFLVP